MRYLMILALCVPMAAQTCPSHAWVGNKCVPFCDENGGVTNGSCKDRSPAPKPLVCGKYQHVDSSVFDYPQVVCVPDTHTVTEREWQEMLARIKALEDIKDSLQSWRIYEIRKGKATK